MKNRFTLLEVGGVLIVFGLSMILFPSIFETAEVHNQSKEDGLYTGLYLISIGMILLIIKWYKNKM